ncbi:MAG: CBS domain-containing protein [Actinomycetota bacterium]
MLVEDVMTTQVPACFRAQPLVAAALVMRHHDVTAIPVIDADSRLVGSLSVDDLVRWQARRNVSQRWTRILEKPVLVAHVMTHEVITVSPGESVADAARVMQYVRRSALPVVNAEGFLVGMVSKKDVASALTRTDDSMQLEIHEQLAQRIGTTPIDAVEVRVESGSVTVSGTVSTEREAQVVRRTVANVTGVVGIHTELVPDVGADLN